MSATRNVVRFPLERTQPRQLVDLSALIDRFGFSERWWRYRISEGMPSHRWGARLRFDPAEVERWLNDRYGGKIEESKSEPATRQRPGSRQQEVGS